MNTSQLCRVMAPTVGTVPTNYLGTRRAGINNMEMLGGGGWWEGVGDGGRCSEVVGLRGQWKVRGDLKC